MGLTNLTVEVANGGRPEVSEVVEFLIDSGATYSVVPRSILERLGIPILGNETFRLASGQRIQRQIGAAVFRYQGRAGGSSVVFGEEGNMVLLGSLTLESLGFGLDPLKRELIQLPMVL